MERLHKKFKILIALIMCAALALTVAVAGGCSGTEDGEGSEVIYLGGQTDGAESGGENSAGENSAGDSSDGVSDGEGAEGGEEADTVVESRDIAISLDTLTATPNYYAAEVESVTVKIIGYIYDNTYRIMLDLCNTCKGSPNAYFKYVKVTNLFTTTYKLQCQYCGSSFALSDVGYSETNSCHPIPILEGNRYVSGDTMFVSYDFLAGYVKYFRNWNG